MDMNGILSGDQMDVLTTVYLVLLTPSVVGSLSVLVVSIVRRKHLQQQVHLLVQLALADLLAALILMSTSVMNKVGIHSNVPICQYSLPLSLSKNAIQGWRTRPAEDEGTQSQCRRKMVSMPVYALVWLIPIFLYLAYVLTSFITTTLLTANNDQSQVFQMKASTAAAVFCSCTSGETPAQIRMKPMITSSKYFWSLW
ncbi:unnamed protein product [Pleuronectes platessa]|uniref:Uncharacterized protein n=1 Tax=Pleuronectes platessa TaxID=8262 RepID=A0A9N7V2N5_PLEPL|nr:unnamed protein product [Pleuronectes platessa]